MVCSLNGRITLNHSFLQPVLIFDFFDTSAIVIPEDNADAAQFKA